MVRLRGTATDRAVRGDFGPDLWPGFQRVVRGWLLALSRGPEQKGCDGVSLGRFRAVLAEGVGGEPGDLAVHWQSKPNAVDGRGWRRFLTENP